MSDYPETGHPARADVYDSSAGAAGSTTFDAAQASGLAEVSAAQDSATVTTDTVMVGAGVAAFMAELGDPAGEEL